MVVDEVLRDERRALGDGQRQLLPRLARCGVPLVDPEPDVRPRRGPRDRDRAVGVGRRGHPGDLPRERHLRRHPDEVARRALTTLRRRGDLELVLVPVGEVLGGQRGAFADRQRQPGELGLTRRDVTLVNPEPDVRPRRGPAQGGLSVTGHGRKARRRVGKRVVGRGTRGARTRRLAAAAGGADRELVLVRVGEVLGGQRGAFADRQRQPGELGLTRRDVTLIHPEPDVRPRRGPAQRDRAVGVGRRGQPGRHPGQRVVDRRPRLDRGVGDPAAVLGGHVELVLVILLQPVELDGRAADGRPRHELGIAGGDVTPEHVVAPGLRDRVPGEPEPPVGQGGRGEAGRRGGTLEIRGEADLGGGRALPRGVGGGDPELVGVAGAQPSDVAGGQGRARGYPREVRLPGGDVALVDPVVVGGGRLPAQVHDALVVDRSGESGGSGRQRRRVGHRPGPVDLHEPRPVEAGVGEVVLVLQRVDVVADQQLAGTGQVLVQPRVVGDDRIPGLRLRRPVQRDRSAEGARRGGRCVGDDLRVEDQVPLGGDQDVPIAQLLHRVGGVDPAHQATRLGHRARPAGTGPELPRRGQIASGRPGHVGEP